MPVYEFEPVGEYDVEYSAKGGQESDIRNLVSGIYFFQLKAGDFIQMRKMILIK